MTVRVVLPAHLRKLAGVAGELEVEVAAPATVRSLLDAVEERHPTLRGTIREHDTGRRRPYVRFYACREDVSHEAPDFPLPAAIVAGDEPFIVLGAMSGG